MKSILIMMVFYLGTMSVETAEFDTMDACIIAGENIEQYYKTEARIKWTCQAK